MADVYRNWIGKVGKTRVSIALLALFGPVLAVIFYTRSGEAMIYGIMMIGSIGFSILVWTAFIIDIVFVQWLGLGNKTDEWSADKVVLNFELVSVALIVLFFCGYFLSIILSDYLQRPHHEASIAIQPHPALMPAGKNLGSISSMPLGSAKSIQTPERGDKSSSTRGAP